MIFLLVISQAYISIGIKTIEAFVGGKLASLKDFVDRPAAKKFIEKHPAGTQASVSFTVYGYGEGEKNIADKDEVNYLEKLYKKEPDTFSALTKQLGSGEFTEVIQEGLYEQSK